MKIAVLLTCFNRREKTLSCLSSLFYALEVYNNKYENKIDLSIYLTDDGCTDGTGNAVRENFIDKNITILQGTGNLFWAGGMRLGWDAALKDSSVWDYYLLINDDTDMLPCLFEDLIKTDTYCIDKYGKQGVYTGFIRDPETKKASFGGSTSHLLTPKDHPLECTSACANVMFFSQSVVDVIGTFDKRYIHAGCDYDYSRMACRAKIPVLTTYSFVGECENEHRKEDIDTSKMTFSQRKKFMYKPTTGRIDYLLYIKKFWPKKYYASKSLFLIELYLPWLYKMIFNQRRKKLSQKHMQHANN
ncbi:MAG: glycosyltransferase family 2 protein [Bacteroidales bacterium]|nr:glycosyltransferase family 2 protein [Bacteroidales bacterium]